MNIKICIRIEYETNIRILRRIELLFIYSFTSLVCIRNVFVITPLVIHGISYIDTHTPRCKEMYLY